MFCTDVDLLHWEPLIAAEAAFASQTLLGETPATLGGSTLTIGVGSFTAAHVRPAQVAVLSNDAGVIGCFPIVSVESASVLTISAIHEGLAAGELVPPSAAGTGLHVTVRTFAPQRQIVTELLTWMSGLTPGSAGRVLNEAVLRKPTVLGTLQLIYNAMAVAAPADDRADLIVRAELYERLYRKSLRGVTVEIDSDGDGVAEAKRLLRLVQFARV